MAERMPDHPDVTRLTLESALCTYKSWHKPNRRYPNVYADMAYLRIRNAESRFGPRFGPLWTILLEALPSWSRLYSTPSAPALAPRPPHPFLFSVHPFLLCPLFPFLFSSFHPS